MAIYPFNIFIDSCAFNPPVESEKNAILELFKLEEEGKIVIEIPYEVENELSKAPLWIARRRLGKIFTIPVGLTEGEKKTKCEIRNLLFNKQNLRQNEVNDVTHIFEAQKYGARYFVTMDKKHILSKAIEIEKRFGMKMVMPSRCLKEIEEWFARYDKNLK